MPPQFTCPVCNIAMAQTRWRYLWPGESVTSRLASPIRAVECRRCHHSEVYAETSRLPRGPRPERPGPQKAT